jgi:hypothetical protein
MNLNEIIESENNNSLPDFEGLSPKDMHQLLYEADNDIFSIKETLDANNEIPILKLIKSLINHIDPEKGVKLTPAGYLPVKIVKDIYNEKIIGDKAIENGISKLSKEIDSESIHLARIVGTLAGCFRKSNTKFYITKRAKSFDTNKDNLKRVFNVFGEKFNLGYLDGYEDNQIAQIGFRYSLYLLLKFGSEKRELNFYAKKYFKAFPGIGNENERNLWCYNLRTFDRYFNYFGIIELEGNWKNETVKNTMLMNKYIINMKKTI